MKRILLQLLFLTSTLSFAQVGVNTTTPDPSSMLDISATNKGVLVPRVSLPDVTTTQLDGINTAAIGLLIWNTNAATTGGNGVGFYFFNGTQWMPITQTATYDHDIYEVGSTNPPNSITDNKFTEGSLAIGSNTAATAVLDVDNATRATSFDVNNTFATNPVGVNVDITSTNSAKTGVKTTFNGASATGNNTFISNIDNTTGNNNRTGILQEFNGTSSSIATSIRGVKNDFKSTASYYASIFGFENSFADNTNSFKYGLTNNFLNGGISQSTGVLNNFNGISTGTAYGVYNSSNNYNGQLNGLYNVFSGTGNNQHYGVYNVLNGTGTGDKYGIYNFIPTTAGGTHYGLYSDVLKAGSYAGYFLGNVSIGTTTTNNYILPPSRGTNGQIMQTDALGNVTWVNPPTDTDDQGTDVFNLTGNILNLSLQNDGVATQTVDLSSLRDADWFEEGGTTPPNAITDNIYHTGDVAIGKNTANYALDVFESDNAKLFAVAVTKTETSGSETAGIFVSKNSIGVGTANNIMNNITSTNVNNQTTGVKNTFLGAANIFNLGVMNDFTVASQFQRGINNVFGNVTAEQVGLYNTFGSITGALKSAGVSNFWGSSNTINANIYGIENTMSSNGNGDRYGLYNYISGTGSGNRYGVYNSFSTTAGGQHFGIYSNVLKTGSFAGYFLGNVSIGTTTTNNYILPPSRGTNGQIMQTDALGNVTWVNPPTDTDDQGTDVFSLTGTTLNLSLQNDGVATQTVDLSSLKDADWFEVGGTTQPDAITDNKYTFGDISIGKSSAASAKLDVDAVVKNTTLSLSNSNATAGTKWGILNNLIVDTTNPNSAGIANNVSGNANFKYGIYNYLQGATTGLNYEYGIVNNHNSSGNVSGFGLFNSFSPTATNTGNYTGLHNEDANANHTGGFVGVNNSSGTTTSSSVFGISNNISGSGSGVRAGVYNNMGGTSSGNVIGTETYMMAMGTGNKYGERITILNTTPGTHYGIYSDVTKANSFAGYFLGNVSIGSNITNNYVLPPSRGTNGQIMQTDGAGNVSWVNPPTDTDDQGTDVFSLTGTTLNLSLQNDGVATQTVDLSTLLGDDDWTDVGANIERQSGDVYIGDTATTNNNLYVSNQIIDWDNTGYFIDPSADSFMGEIQFDNGAPNDPSIRFFDADTGFFSPGFGLTAYSNNSVESFRIHNTGNISIGQTIDPNFKFSVSTLSNTGNIKIGPTNFTDSLIKIDHDGDFSNGMDITMSSAYTLASRSAISAVNTWHDINVDVSRFDHLTSELFGIKSIVTTNITGSEYGIYSQALQSNGYAGYFLGRVAVGNTTANTYILPPSRGTNGQIMQTDGSGNVSWVNSVVDTDNQQIDVLSLTGDTLNISLQDDAVATQTLNLGAIDNQGTDVFSLTGNTLNLSLQNDGVATQTVDLSSLANDWKLTGNAGTVAGTNFIGTTDAQDLTFRTNNITKLTLTQRGQLSITNTGGSVLVGSGAGDADDFTLNQNTFIGTVSGESTSSGNLNSALGFNSLNANTLGLGNTAVGANALNVNVDGNNNTGLGRGANVSTTNLTNATAVGFNSTVNASNKIRLGNATITVVEGQVAYTNPSDARFKFNVQENVPGLDFIKKLKPVTYNFDTKKFDEHVNQNRNKDEVANEDFSKSTAIIRTGFLAQDVEKICTDLGYNFDGLHIPDANNPTDNYGIAYSQFIMPIVKAVQEQQVIIETQKTELEQLKSELEKYKQLEERIKALEQK